jgi:phosphoribosyl 1,2-cyclic phosphodiesterase
MNTRAASHDTTCGVGSSGSCFVPWCTCHCHDAGVVTPTLRSMPNRPRTPIRGIRVPDELWAAAQQVAADKGETVSDEVRRSLERYVKKVRRGKA